MQRFVIIISLIFNTICGYSMEYIYTEDGVNITWQKNDIACLHTDIGTTIKQWALTPSGNSTTLSSYGWTLTANTAYYGYFPYDKTYTQEKYHHSAFPIAYTGQQQNGNNNTAHLSAYDFMTTQATTGAADVTFNFTHLGSIIRFNIVMPEDATVDSLTLMADGAKPFIKTATMNATNNTITPVTMSDSLTIQFNSIELKKGDILTAYMMAAPCNTVAMPLTLSLTTTDGKKATTTLNGAQILSGKTYPMEITEISSFRKVMSRVSAPSTEAQLAKPAAIQLPEAKSLQYPNAYAPNFPTDRTNIFTELPLMGDADNDGEVTLYDAKAVRLHYLTDGLTEINKKKADMNGDGQITIDDANAIINITLSNATTK